MVTRDCSIGNSFPAAFYSNASAKKHSLSISQGSASLEDNTQINIKRCLAVGGGF